MSLKKSNQTKKEVIFYQEISMMGFTELHIVEAYAAETCRLGKAFASWAGRSHSAASM